MIRYVNCAGCGNVHDYMEGGWIRDDERQLCYFVCMDCADTTDKSKQKQILLRARENQPGSRYMYDITNEYMNHNLSGGGEA